MALRRVLVPLMICAAVVIDLLPVNSSAQWNKKSPSSWSSGDVYKVLSDSPWARTLNIQTTSDLERQERYPRADHTGAVDATRDQIQLRIRLASAKPVREALTRYPAQLRDERARDEIHDLLEYFNSEDQGDFIIIMISCDSEVESVQRDQIREALQNGDAELLKKECYLEAGDQRAELVEYKSWGRNSGLFKFPRSGKGNSLISRDTPELKFRAKLGLYGSVVAIFKPKEMLFEGALEY